MELITRKQLAEKMKVTERTIDMWRERGLPFIRVGGRFVRFEEMKVLAWLKSQSQSN